MVTQTLNHRLRMEACLSGVGLDRTPVALWRHFPVDDQTPGGLAAASTQFQLEYDFDFMKVTPASSFCLRDWGVEDVWRGNPEGTREYTRWVINQPEDWSTLPILDPTAGALGAQLDCLRMLVNEFGTGLPILQTIFNPLAQAKHLVAPGMLPVHMHQYPDALEVGLQRITETTLRFIEEVVKTGVSGIFYAIQHAQYSLLSSAEFERFGKAFDMPLFAPVRDLWLNLLHVHGENLMFDLVLDYPVQIINWHDRETSPSLLEAQARFPGVVCGGMRQWDTMVLGTPEKVLGEAVDALEHTGGKRFILGTGCVVPITAPHGNLVAARNSVEDPGHIRIL